MNSSSAYLCRSDEVPTSSSSCGFWVNHSAVAKPIVIVANAMAIVTQRTR